MSEDVIKQTAPSCMATNAEIEEMLTPTPQKISENPYAMVCDLKPGDGEIGRLAGVDVWLQNGEPFTPYSGDAGDETE